MISEFIISGDDKKIFLLCGYAGTGKTTLISALVRTMEQLGRKSVLLAPTGRAAKVFSSYSGKSAYTIHKKIYRQKSILDAAQFTLMENRAVNTLFIVDEASMISNAGGSNFGSGALLDDLIEFVYSGNGCSLLLLGDTAQLPPVGEELSPALSCEYLSSMFLNVTAMELTQVMRQLDGSGVLYNATKLREVICNGETGFLPKVRLRGFADICRVSGEELIEAIESSYNDAGINETIVLCRSNKRANVYNEGIRRRILYREDELSRGDVLMVVKNNYYWIERLVREQHQAQPLSFIANGDIAVVRRVRRTRELYGFRFADVLLSFPDYDDFEMETTVLLDTLHSESPSLTREESNRLFEAVMEDYADISQKKERYKRLREDPHFNALQIKYAYAVTCHKAQGGQWSAIYLDQGYLPPDTSATDYYRWLYTAFTRATEQVYLVNWPTEETK